MDHRFDIAIRFVLDIEGGYVNDPDDKGGETKYGISKRAYPDVDIANLTEDRARSIYYRDYWDLARCGKLPGPLAVAVFDATVNHGQSKAVVMLQQALGVRADGINGPNTQAAAAKADAAQLLDDFLIRRTRFYFDIVTANSSQARFLKGWLRRVFHLHRYILTHQGDLS